MTISFGVEILERLAELDRGQPELIRTDPEDAEYFGNATATIELDGLRPHFVRDRGVVTVEVGFQIINPVGPLVHPALHGFTDGEGQPVCPLELFAVVLEDVDTNVATLAKHYGFETTEPDYESNPPPGPFLDLEAALKFLKRHWEQVSKASSNRDLQWEAGEVQYELQARFERYLKVE